MDTKSGASLHVQIQPSRSPDLDIEEVVNRLLALAPATVSRGDDAGRYVNVDFNPAEARGLWSAVEGQILTDQGLAGFSIVCCTGENGWDDYLLLHHYDPSEPLDELA